MNETGESGITPSLRAAIEARGGEVDGVIFDKLTPKFHPDLRAILATRWQQPIMRGQFEDRLVEGLVFEFEVTTADVRLGIRLATSDRRTVGYVVQFDDINKPLPAVYWYDFTVAAASIDPSVALRGMAAPSLEAFLTCLQPDESAPPAAGPGEERLGVADLPLEVLAARWDNRNASGILSMYNMGVSLVVDVTLPSGRVEINVERGDGPEVSNAPEQAPLILAKLVREAAAKQ